MSKRLFVGGLAWSTTEEGLREAFADYGVLECKIITHKEGEHEGKSKGFGFVQVEQGDAAIAEMDGAEVDGRYLRVSEAHQQGGRRNGNGGGHRRGGERRGAGGGKRRDGGRSYRQ